MKSILIKFIFNYWRRLALALALLAIVAGLMINFRQSAELKTVSIEDDVIKKEIKINKCSFEVEIADNERSRAQGLSNREKICDKCGMLFLFSQKDTYGFWMRAMHFPLDIVWISEDQIMEVTEQIPADSWDTFFPKEAVNRVLELNAGDVERCKIKVGDKLIM